jgi:uncharacterized protein involved in exopolysaccharide biosynthesis
VTQLFHTLVNPFQVQAKEGDGSHEPMSRSALSGLVSRFLGRLEIEPRRNSKLVKVSFSSFDPELAARVANAVVANYIESSLQRRYSAGNEAREFLQKQLIHMQAALERADQALQDFARRKHIADLEEHVGLANQKLKELNEKLTEVQVEKVGYGVLNEQISQGKTDTLQPIVANELLNTLQTQYVAAMAEHAKLSGQFRPEYPKLLQVSEQMTQLESQIAKEKQRVIDSIKNQYHHLLRQERVLQEAIKAQGNEIMALNQEAVQYNILKREVQTNRELYDGLLQRMKEVGVSSGIRENNISVIDEAEPPLPRTSLGSGVA